MTIAPTKVGAWRNTNWLAGTRFKSEYMMVISLGAEADEAGFDVLARGAALQGVA